MMTYIEREGFLLPNLVTKEETMIRGKYAMMRLEYLKSQKKGMYQAMLMKGTLINHLNEIEETSQKRVELIMEQMKVKLQVTEELKLKNQMKWTGMMNSIKNQAEEIIMRELIYV